MPDESIYDNKIYNLKVTDLLCGITWDYTSTKFFFTAVYPKNKIIDQDYLRLYFAFSYNGDDNWEHSEKPCDLYIADSLENTYQGDSLCTWMNWIFEDNTFNEYLRQHTCEDVKVRIVYYNQKSDEAPLAIEETVHVYFRDDNVVNGKCTVPLPNDGWEVGEYTFHCVYPETRNYTMSEWEGQLAYESWNWGTEIILEGCLEDEEGNLTNIREIGLSGNPCFVYRVTRTYDGSLVQSGEVTINFDEADENTIIKGTDLILNYDDKEGIGEDNTLVYTVTNTRRVDVDSGEVTIDNKAQVSSVLGDTFDTRQWISSPTTAAGDDYVSASSSEFAIFFGRYCHTYWGQSYLVNNYVITAGVTISSGDYAFGLMDVKTDLNLCKVKVEDGVATLTIGKDSEVIDMPADLEYVEFKYVLGQINIVLTGTKSESSYFIGAYNSSYAVFFETFSDLDSIGCTCIRGVYGGD